jgi:hypothetical protein
MYHNWLVLWNMNFMTFHNFHILGMSSSQLNFIFFRGVEPTNQLIYFVFLLQRESIAGAMTHNPTSSFGDMCIYIYISIHVEPYITFVMGQCAKTECDTTNIKISRNPNQVKPGYWGLLIVVACTMPHSHFC